MGAKIPNIDTVLKKLNNKQKYLGIKFSILTLMIIFIYIPILSTKSVDNLVFLNSTLLLSLPIFFEYRYGLDTISTFTNLSRWLGYVISGIIVLFCFISYMGGIVFTYEKKVLAKFIILGFEVDIVYWKIIIWALPVIAFFDWIFSFGPREAIYYKLQDKLNNDIIEEINKSEDNFEEKVKRKKQEIMKAVPKGE